MSTVKDDQSVRELELDKSHEPSGPHIRCPLCDWSPRKEDRWSCDCGHLWNTFDTGGVCGVSPPVDFNPVPQVWRLVAAFGLVRAMTKSRLVQSAHEQIPELIKFGTVSELKSSHTLQHHRE